MSEYPDIDIKENYIKCLNSELLSILLKDRCSGKNIIWATDIYSNRGPFYDSQEHITGKLITGRFGKIIRPRIDKSHKEQKIRIKNKAEVFTPSWICNEMNNHLCDEWFEDKNVFNTAKEKTWIVNHNKILFANEKKKNWQDFVKLKVLEISCGEAPFLVSRYDTTTGQWIDVGNRIGMLDRKLRVVNEQCDSEPDWYNWTLEAIKSTYGYEWQGDSLLIARENILFTFIDYYIAKFENFPTKEYLVEVAKILSWNIWQMDGLKYVIPNSCKPIPQKQMSLFDDEKQYEQCQGCSKNDNNLHTGIYCKIMNWETKRSIKFFKGEKRMKFDFVIGNPPYQQESVGEKKADESIYHYFIDASYKLGKKIELITPSKFLFNNGNTPTEWNKKMLNDPHFKVIRFEPVANKVFPNVSFKGGVAIHYYDHDVNFEPIIQFTEFSELNSILKKVLKFKNKSLTTIIYNQNKFNLSTLYSDYPELRTLISSDGKEKRMTSGCLKYECFTDVKRSEKDIQILGVINNKRTRKYLNRKYLEEPNENIDKYKVIIPANNGSGAIGEVLSTPLIGEPLIGYTQTFIAVGAFNLLKEAENALKYVKGKFCRVMLGVLKVTQNGKREMWQLVPIQDFTDKSDIDWSKSIHEIDLQLYKKYDLDENEIAFIESHVKEMK
ncbi:MAG: Eco57I restriction-modification methylase domain-containing protein [Christensenellales bacterium]